MPIRAHRPLLCSLLLACLGAGCTGGGAGAPPPPPASALEAAPSAAEGTGLDETPGAHEGSEAVGAPSPDEPTAPEDPPVPTGPEGQTAAPCGEPPEGMVCIPGGWFVRGVPEPLHVCDQSDQGPDGDVGAHPEARVWIDTFHLDLTEVTYQAYQRCASDGSCRAVRPLYRDYDAPTQPMTGMNWFDARDFCAARGARLPTEAEFEAASRGPEGDLYPWGDEPATCERAIIMDERGRACGREKRGSSPETGRIWEVASRPAGRYGLFDMVGNAEEWVADWWAPSYEDCGDACLGANPAGPCGGAEPCDGMRYRVIRGGSWYWPAEHATGVHRRRYAPDNDPPHHFGFRCAMTVASGS